MERNQEGSEKTRLLANENLLRKYTQTECNERQDKDFVPTALHITIDFKQTEFSNSDYTRYAKSKNEDGSSRISRFFRRPKKKLLILGYSAFSRLFLNAAISVFNPMFPVEAKEKIIGKFWVKFTFGIFYAVIFVTAPFIGRYLSKIGPNFVFLSSLYVGSFSNLIYAFLHHGPGNTSCLVLIVLTRMLTAVSRAGNSTVTQAIVFYEFRGTSMGLAQSILQSCTIIGCIIGPTVSGFLYDAGGYCLPYYVLGGTLILHALITHFTLPNVDEIISSKKGSNISSFTLVKSPLFLVVLLCSGVGAVGILNVLSTLTDILLPFGITMSTVGLVFALLNVFSTIATFFWAYVTDGLNKERVAILIGSLMFSSSFLLMGPAPFLPFVTQTMTTICISIAILGFACGTCVTPVTRCLLTATKELGYHDDDFDILSVVSGLYNSIIMAGGFLGQFVFGLVGIRYGNAVMFTSISFLNGFMFLITIALFSWRKWKSKS